MGISLSSLDVPRGKSQRHGDTKDTVVIERKSLHEPNLILNCENDMSMSNSILPGQVEEIEAIVRDFAYSCVYVDEDSNFPSGTASILSTDRDISIRGITGPEFSTESPETEANSRTLESSIATEKKRFPALASIEKPKRVKRAMFESLLTIVPSLKCTAPSRPKGRKQSRNQIQTENYFEDEEAPGEFILGRVCSSSNSNDDGTKVRELEKEQYFRPFSTVPLFEGKIDLFERHRMLSRVDEFPENKLE